MLFDSIGSRALKMSSLRVKYPALFVLLILVGGSPLQAADPVLEHDILPILTKNCMSCHGGFKQKGKLDLRTFSAMLAGGESGPAVVAGKLEKSEMWLQISKGEMPKGKKKKLSEEDKQTIKRWIVSGAQTFAQRNKQADPLLPAGKKHEPKQVAESIDKHIDRKLASAKLKAGPLSDDAEFLRRVYLHLTGRVATSEQAAAFLDDKAGDKRAKLIDKLLDSPEFGQQLGRTWRDWISPPELPSDMNGGKQPIKQTRELGVWFAKRFSAGDGWDKIVRDLLTVSGQRKDGKNAQLIFYGLSGQGSAVTPDGSARSVELSA